MIAFWFTRPTRMSRSGCDMENVLSSISNVGSRIAGAGVDFLRSTSHDGEIDYSFGVTVATFLASGTILVLTPFVRMFARENNRKYSMTYDDYIADALIRARNASES